MQYGGRVFGHNGKLMRLKQSGIHEGNGTPQGFLGLKEIPTRTKQKPSFPLGRTGGEDNARIRYCKLESGAQEDAEAVRELESGKPS
jgi:hypothetical protein